MLQLHIPGFGGSHTKHWHSRWESENSAIERLQVEDWSAPDLTAWMQALDDHLARSPQKAVLVAHSLACLLVAHYARHYDTSSVAGAFLVAVPDTQEDAFPREEAASFIPVPQDRLPFPTQMIASTTDPYASQLYARETATQWGASLVDIGAAGHINGPSGHGDWPQGKELFAKFVETLSC